MGIGIVELTQMVDVTRHSLATFVGMAVLTTALATGGCATGVAYEGKRVVEVEFADASPCLQQCSLSFRDCVPPVKTSSGLGLTPGALVTDLTARKHEVRRCRRDSESCNLSCNATDARTIALASELP